MCFIYSKCIISLVCFLGVIKLFTCQYGQAGYAGQAPAYASPAVYGQAPVVVPAYAPQTQGTGYNQMPQSAGGYQSTSNQYPSAYGQQPSYYGQPAYAQPAYVPSSSYGQNYPQGQRYPSPSSSSYPMDTYGTGYMVSKNYPVGLYERGVTPQPSTVNGAQSSFPPYTGLGCQQIMLAPYAKYLYGRPCSDAIGSRCYLTCEQGFDLIGSCFRVCGADRRWSGSEMLCVRPGITCSSPDFHTSVRVISGCQNMAGFSCTLGCKNGAVPTAAGVPLRNGIIFCQVDGRWSHEPSLITCGAGGATGREVREGTLPVREGVVTSGGNSGSISSSSSVPEMPKAQDVEAIAATADAKPSGAIERESQTVSPGKLIYSTSSTIRHSDSHHHGRFWITRFRDRGKVTSSVSERTQGEQASKEQEQELYHENEIVYVNSRRHLSVVRVKRQSKPVTCRPLNPPKNGQSSGQCAPGIPGKICKFNCIQNFTMSGLAFITCGMNGEWSSAPAKCSK